MRAGPLLGLFVAAAAGCAARAPTEAARLTQRIEEMAQQQASLHKQLEEVQNRLFLLEDKVDTSRVAIERSKSPRLPVIRLRPGASQGDEAEQQEPAGQLAAEEDEPTQEQEDRGSEEQPAVGRSVVEQRSVVYRGEASRGGPRPVLRLHESSGSSEPLTLSGPDPAQVTEKLPVIPLPRPAPPPALDPKPMQIYQRALARYRSGDSAGAEAAFRDFLQRHPRHAYADNALYWLAECSYDSKNFGAALKLFRQVVEQFPNGNKAPDALLKMAYCYVRMKDTRNARIIFGQVVESYPRSQVARLASEAMARLAQGGGPT
jgi:tol-pal system protein YbgF